MYISRVQVSDFLALKNVDVAFEHYFVTQFFPLGSVTGNGKSTLLQLIFVLLNCSANPMLYPFVRTALEYYDDHGGCDTRVIMNIEIQDAKQIFSLYFYTYPDENEYSILEFESTTKNKYFLCCISPDFDNASDLQKFLEKLSQKIFFCSSSPSLFLFLGQKYLTDIYNDVIEYSPTSFLNRVRALQSLKNLYIYDVYSALKLVRDSISLLNIWRGQSLGDAPDFPSEGELRRLSLYWWMKERNINDAIVLIDGLEMGQHPDWQYNMARDLITDYPSNQYIVATHSYAVCENVTPSHVKVLDGCPMSPL